VNDGGSSGADCFDIKTWSDAVKLTSTWVARFRKSRYLIRKVRCLSKMKPQTIKCMVFTALHGMQTRSSDDNSVCLSNACIVTNRKKDLSRLIPYERSFSLVLWEEEWSVGATPSTWNFGSCHSGWR